MGTVPAIASAIVALAALLISSLALAASRRSASASELSSRTAQRALALAMEVRWSLVRAPAGDDLYFLTNNGREPAYGVRVTTSLLTWREDKEWETISGGETVEIFAVLAAEDTDNTVMVTWHATSDSQSVCTWRHPLPWEPRRSHS
jgi:hypothetical protein